MIDWNAVKDAMVASLEDRAAAFLKRNQPVAEIIRDRAQRLVELGADWELAKAEDKPRIERSMTIVHQTVIDQVDAAALSASVDERKWVGDLAHTAFGVAIKLIRTLVFKV